jgi:hypothetical protein
VILTSRNEHIVSDIGIIPISGGFGLISGYRISCDLIDMDIIAIHRFIFNSYKAKDIPLETMEKAMNN